MSQYVLEVTAFSIGADFEGPEGLNPQYFGPGVHPANNSDAKRLISRIFCPRMCFIPPQKTDSEIPLVSLPRSQTPVGWGGPHLLGAYIASMLGAQSARAPSIFFASRRL